MRLNYLLKLLLFWLLFFLCERLFFIIYHFKKIIEVGNIEVIKSFFYGIKLDIALASYLLIIPALLWIIKIFVRYRWPDKINQWLNYAFITIISALCVANIRIYDDWNMLLNARALGYLQHPQQALASISTGNLLFLIVLFIAFTAFSVFLFHKIAGKKIIPKPEKKLHNYIISLVIFPLLLVSARGGVQLIPVNESAAWFSKTPLHNHIAVNHTWYLLNNLLNYKSDKNPYDYYSKEEAEARVKKLYEAEGSAENILITGKPNVVLIILESYTADVIGALGGIKGVTPNFDKLAEKGLLFTDIYSSGFRTDQGIVSVLSGYPAQPNNSIIRIPEKSERLPSVCTELIKDGYYPSFYYGGETAFNNLELYLLNSGFEKIINKDDFKKKQLGSKWGAHDEFVFSRHLNDLASMPQPFFSVLLTLSSHEPYDVPMQPAYETETDSGKFINSVHYTDKAIGEYFKEAEKNNWYKNTLFVLVADHGHRLPHNRNPEEPVSHRVPLLLYGEALKSEYKDKNISLIGNHHDLPATLLYQLNPQSKQFGWSKNLLNPQAKSFAYIANETGVAWVAPEQQFIWHHEAKQHVPLAPGDTLNDSLLMDAKAYLQLLYQDFLEK